MLGEANLPRQKRAEKEVEKKQKRGQASFLADCTLRLYARRMTRAACAAPATLTPYESAEKRGLS
jgi:hypothetical protein